MKYLDEYRDPVAARKLLQEIRRTASRGWRIMEVCGGQTHSLLQHGIEQELDGVVELIHGPGCPVCVTPLEAIEFALELARQAGVMLTSFGDMLRVPGREQSLLDVQSAGGQVRTVYSPLDALQWARQHPEQQVVFFAVGFETTAPATALAVLQAAQEGIENFSLLVSHVRVQPAMESIAKEPNHRVEAFLAAGHVCTVMGYETYVTFAKQFRLPVVVTGFEPLDLLSGILAAVRQLETGEARVSNEYGRTVRPAGNLAAQDVVQSVYEVCDRSWRGLGIVPSGGLRLRPEWRRFDAAVRWSHLVPFNILEPERCRSAEVLTGRIRPTECEAFGTECRPESPLGAPMVSSEGACAAYFRFAPNQTPQSPL
ncbi:MAG: hydrogenase formation protein HypD [Planctomycetaceae bacterium]